jgi:hypothetical protein
MQISKFQSVVLNNVRIKKIRLLETMKISVFYKKITLPYQILLIILLTFLASLYFSMPHLDKNTAELAEECEVSDKANTSYYQTGEFNVKDLNPCKPEPQWPMLPKDKS